MPILARVFQRLHDAPRSDAEKKASAAYASCLTSESFVPTSASLHDRRLAMLAATTPADLGKLLGEATRRHGTSIFRVAAVAQGSTVHLASWTTLGYVAGLNFTVDTGVAQYVAQKKALILQGEPTIDPAEAERLAEAAGRFLHNTALQTSVLPADATPAAPTGRAGVSAAAPRVDWDVYFAALGIANPPADFLVDDLQRTEALDRGIAATAIEDIVAYLVVNEYRAAPPPSTTPKDTLCARRIASLMSDAVEATFLEEAGVDDLARAKTAALWKSIRAAFAAELEEEPFLDDATRAAAITKLNAMGQVLDSSANHDPYADLVVDPTEDYLRLVERVTAHDYDRELAGLGKAPSRIDLIEPASEVDAAYDPDLNKIDVPAGILGGYFFSAQAPDLANFAAIGSVLGHELTHGFDNTGRRYDAAGNERDWWTPSSATAFDARAAQMTTEYSAFAVDNATKADGTPMHVNGKLTLGENIADNGGLKTAFRASNVATSTAPMVAGFTPVQQFFLGFAQLWCGKDPTAHATRSLVSDVHSPSKARVNVTLSNFATFATAFQCQAGAKMVAAPVCQVW